MTVITAPLRNGRDGSTELAAHRLAHHNPFPFLRLAPVVREPQKVERSFAVVADLSLLIIRLAKA